MLIISESLRKDNQLPTNIISRLSIYMRLAFSGITIWVVYKLGIVGVILVGMVPIVISLFGFLICIVCTLGLVDFPSWL